LVGNKEKFKHYTPLPPKIKTYFEFLFLLPIQVTEKRKEFDLLWSLIPHQKLRKLAVPVTCPEKSDL